jgi:hypothetical protein
MVEDWALRRCVSAGLDHNDFHIRLIHSSGRIFSKYLSNTRTLIEAGVVSGDEFQVVVEHVPLPALCQSSDTDASAPEPLDSESSDSEA